MEVGANVPAGTGSQRILNGARKMHGIREGLEESVRRWDCWQANYSDPWELVQAKRKRKAYNLVTLQAYVLLSGFQSLNGDVMIVTIFIND